MIQINVGTTPFIFDEETELNIKIDNLKSITEQLAAIPRRLFDVEMLMANATVVKHERENVLEVEKMEYIANTDPMKYKTEKSKEAAYFADDPTTKLKKQSEIITIDFERDKCRVVADSLRMKANILLKCIDVFLNKETQEK